VPNTTTLSVRTANAIGAPMNAPDMNAWIDQVKALPNADKAGMMLVHRGIVRGTTRSGTPVGAMDLTVDRVRLEELLVEARGWEGVVAVRAWVNEGALAVGDDIMSVLVAGDIRENVFEALQRLVRVIKTEVVTEHERP
jgi:molybdopterin synthase catalytic subunit